MCSSGFEWDSDSKGKERKMSQFQIDNSLGLYHLHIHSHTHAHKSHISTYTYTCRKKNILNRYEKGNCNTYLIAFTMMLTSNMSGTLFPFLSNCSDFAPS